MNSRNWTVLLVILLCLWPCSIRGQFVNDRQGQGQGQDAANPPIRKGDRLPVDEHLKPDTNDVRSNNQARNQQNPPAQAPAEMPQNPRLPPVPANNEDRNRADVIKPIIRDRRPPPQSAAGDHLADRPECAQDIAKYCSKIPRQSDVAVLQCLQDIGERDDSLNDDCQHLLWEFKLNLTQDERFRKAAEEFCKEYLDVSIFGQGSECGKITNERGHMISCLSDLKDTMTDGHCKSFLTRMQSVIFTDFRLVGPFMTACREDVRKFSCGQLDDDRFNKATEPPPQPGQNQQQQPPKIPHSQGATLDCLIRKLIESGKGDKELDPTCRHEIIRIAELQADDFHLDRPLFFACRTDRERFCSGVTAGEGRVFQCLAEHRYQSDMSRECQSTLDVRLQLLGRDYRIAKQLLSGCKAEMRQYNCEFRPNDPKQPMPPDHMYLSYLILCLEEAGRKETNRFSPQCQTELFEHRRMLMSDYRMNPEIVLTCSDDITKFCGDRLEDGGRTLHCLMQHARDPRATMSSQCKQAVTQLMVVADVGSDYRVDRVLYTDCRALIDSVCQKQATTQSDVLSCLMTNVESPLMTEDCENRLLEVQYFLSRDYKLDPALFHACKADAAEKCGDKGPWVDPNKAVVPAPPIDPNQPQQQPQPTQKEQTAERGYLVLTCLYRGLYSEKANEKVSPKCAKEVQRVMRERSMNVNLMPHIEDACLLDLADRCSQKTGHGEELRCLQASLGKNQLSKACEKAVQDFTEQETMDSRLDHALMRACAPVLEQHCKDSLDKVVDKGDILDCLLRNKGVQAMNSKCRTFVNHYELISLKDYKFTYKFRQACKEDIENHCIKDGQAADKATIVGCLSELVVKHALLNEKPQVSKECRKQLRAEYFSLEAAEKQIGDPKLADFCAADIAKFCNQAETASQAFECVRAHKQDLEPRCRKYVFKKEKLEFQDNTFDVTLNRVCADEIRTHCAREQPERVLYCLKTKLEREGVQKSFECMELVRTRKVEQATDIRLNPMLSKMCGNEMQAVCENELDQIKNNPDVEAEGVVIGCLRRHVTTHMKGVIISAGCQVEVRRIIYESEVDPSLDPPFYKSCKEEIMSKCSQQLMAKEDHHSILECMKMNYKRGTISKPNCKKELARKINEELADIHLDPELNMACATDIQHYCDDVKPGDGKLLKCLLDASKSSNVRLTQQCHAKLSDRDALWRHVRSDNLPIDIPGELGSAVKAIYDSPVRNTLATVLLVIVVVIFAMGMCCGRVTRRVRRELKNR